MRQDESVKTPEKTRSLWAENKLKMSVRKSAFRSQFSPLAVAWAILLLPMLTACWSSPSVSDGKQAIQDCITKESEGRIKLTRFEKSNGAGDEIAGFKIYKLEFESEIEFTENCKWVTGGGGQEVGFRTAKSVAQPKSGFSWNSFLSDSQNPGPDVTKGLKIQIFGAIHFVKNERGWYVVNIQITQAKPLTNPIRSNAKEPATIREAAEKGDANAQYEFGMAITKGQKSDTNDVEAVKWYRKSAEQGYAPGQNALGTMFQFGRGINKNNDEAVKWYRKAVEQGNVKAQVNLGNAYIAGAGVEKNPIEGVKLIRKAADSGSSFGQFYLGLAYEGGSGVDVDYTEAVKWLRKSAGQGYPPAECYLARAYMNGSTGLLNNKDLAIEWYRKAAEHGHAGAQAFLQEFEGPEKAEKARALEKTREDVMADLRLIKNATALWALENKKGLDGVPSEANLRDFFSGRIFPIHSPGGQYLLHSAKEGPESTTYGKLDQ